MTSVNNKLRTPGWLAAMLKVTAALTIIAAGGVTLYVFGQKPEIEKSSAEKLPGEIVRTADVELFQEPVIIEFDGEATTLRVVEVGAEVAGRVAEKSPQARTGFFVPQGHVLFRIDAAEYELAVQRREAEIEQIDEEIRSLNVDLDNTATLIALAEEDLTLEQAQLQRIEELYQRQAASEIERDNARQQELMSRDALQRLRNELSKMQQQKATAEVRRKVALVALQQAELDLRRCTIPSPIDGRIVEDVIEQGNFVSPGQALTRLSDSSKMEVRCQLQADEVAWIWEQQMQQTGQRAQPERDGPVYDPIELIPVPCEVVFTFEGVETIWQGELSRFEGSGMNRQTRTFPARVIVHDPLQTQIRSLTGHPVHVAPPTLVSGMFVSVRVPVTPTEPLFRIPVRALRPGNRIWLRRDGKLEIVQAPIARVTDEFALLRSYADLSTADEVVVSPLATAVEGMPLRRLDESLAQRESTKSNPQQLVDVEQVRAVDVEQERAVDVEQERAQ